ncbi:uncharacterized protein FIBRA_04923 [Fibroporia radiculosa]|uniref:WKF domain-containing protein n=1 Tax=Fibroporia radiculosa TaxID=599839 RepID=J4IAF3_9APHY|nr:uncharacterized protein FIBRA_04923 [Fibroporia radiculosa]CCM02811.1 predicted protein [Fibroporia radiculosa]
MAAEHVAAQPKSEKKVKKSQGKAHTNMDGVDTIAESTNTEKEKRKRKAKVQPPLENDTVEGSPVSAEPINSSFHAVTEKKKKSQRQENGGDERTVELEPAPMTEGAQGEKRKKKKQKKREAEAQDEIEVAGEGVTPEDHGNEASPENPNGDNKTHKKKRVHKEGGLSGVQEQGQTQGEQTKQEKRKRRKRVLDDSNTQMGDAAKEPEKKKSKRRKPNTHDPNEDESLSEQARKALGYAYTQFEDPTGWKFNKARQNWIVRNLWSVQAIPEIHFSLVAKYIANMQGGARDSLVKVCKDAVSSLIPDKTTLGNDKSDSTTTSPLATESSQLSSNDWADCLSKQTSMLEVRLSIHSSNEQDYDT